MHSLSLADDGTQVEIEVGDALSIRLPENATSGHRWAPDDLSPGVVALTDEEPGYSGGAGIGAGGEVTFQVRGVAPGRAEIAFKRWREWEGSSSIVERFRAVVIVSEPG
ncbi:MAG TPA: protease inhibitor I42 family protein [Allosphingosinicella sp.]|jgi:inhibitor of cysteine peptidase|nr:protease inhibitor I42 family protein [Allosphingosinicella sp.]